EGAPGRGGGAGLAAPGQPDDLPYPADASGHPAAGRAPERSTPIASASSRRTAIGLIPMASHVLVTGGAGFIGSHLTRRLLARGGPGTLLRDFHDFQQPGGQ